MANSNTGHDAGAEPRATFAHEDLAAVIDFGHRAVHLTAVVSKTIVQRSTDVPRAAPTSRDVLPEGGGDSWAGATRTTSMALSRVRRCSITSGSTLPMCGPPSASLPTKLAGESPCDKDGDGIPGSLTKVEMLRDAVLASATRAMALRMASLTIPRVANLILFSISNRTCVAPAQTATTASRLVGFRRCRRFIAVRRIARAPDL